MHHRPGSPAQVREEDRWFSEYQAEEINVPAEPAALETETFATASAPTPVPTSVPTSVPPSAITIQGSLPRPQAATEKVTIALTKGLPERISESSQKQRRTRDSSDSDLFSSQSSEQRADPGIFCLPGSASKRQESVLLPHCTPTPLTALPPSLLALPGTTLCSPSLPAEEDQLSSRSPSAPSVERCPARSRAPSQMRQRDESTHAPTRRPGRADAHEEAHARPPDHPLARSFVREIAQFWPNAMRRSLDPFPRTMICPFLRSKSLIRSPHSSERRIPVS